MKYLTYHQAWYKGNKKHIAIVKNRYNKRNKLYAFSIYENKCGNCGNDDLIVLEWHHKYPNKKKENSQVLELRIRKSNKRDVNIQLLCANCHIHANIKDKTKLHSLDENYSSF